ncbi:tail fiber domain-containing protein [Lacihabitans sp. LS3-19]|uniref:tail fiber domain-containing protein n=1 Tax=Lacihabitans sp. LS3-19 TaxID=2487335 RepID=UPI0020CCEBE0|nr:tail fiber domain-containing protein [Lacihabitans sp. LS3-19]MCP9767752.1 tail fiber domain-containing protein [Lacihabitans sp. LS3-19]
MKTKLKLLFSLLSLCILLQSQVSINSPKINTEIIEKSSDAKAIADIVHGDDVIIGGSLCVGQDCVNGESFGFDTQRLKENNLQIHFDDTSVSSSFPKNDWRIIINDSANGGASYFAVEDATAGNRPFYLAAGSGANALYVSSSGGNVGLGTSSPAMELQITDGDSPTIRLEQSSSSGFTPQTWDIAGNETNFFIRDASNGSKLPFKIFPNSPTGSIEISPTGVTIKNVGLIDPTSPSDKRLKRDMIAIADATSLLKKLVPKTFYFNDKSVNNFGLPKGKQYGLIAQEVEVIMPELIRNISLGKDKTQYKSVGYESFISILIQGFKEQQSTIEKQSNEIRELKNEIAKYSDLEMRIVAIENSQNKKVSNKTSK